MREQLLHARDARQALIDRASAALRPGQGVAGTSSHASGTVVFASTGVPGAEKNPSGLAPIFSSACERVASLLDADVLHRGIDALGPWALFRTSQSPAEAKRACVRLEEEHRAGRLLDLDVYDADAKQVDRPALGLPPRPCLVCDRPAVECIRLRRHGASALSAAVGALLGGAPPSPAPRAAERLAACLVTGARVELALTPKPGLVDRDDNGSHPDLSLELMSRSIDLLPIYFDELLTLTGRRARAAPLRAIAGLAAPSTPDPLPADTLAACVEAGRHAERRMLDAIGSNAHRGYIFLGGLTLLASLDGEERLRDSMRALATAVARTRGPVTDDGSSHGTAVRQHLGLGGIEREALNALPSVFEHALPALRARRATYENRRGADTDESLHYAMAVLMQEVEDTTTVHRGGLEGLQRLRADGRALRQSIESGHAYLPWLRELNTTYRSLNLTMGGVADCLALTVALDRWLT